MNTEGTGNAAISVGKYLKLYFYNTTNVYSGKTCVSGYHPSWLIAKTTDEKTTAAKINPRKYLLKTFMIILRTFRSFVNDLNVREVTERSEPQINQVLCVVADEYSIIMPICPY